MISPMLFFVSVLCMVIPMLQLVLPSFQRQRRVAQLASLVNQTEDDRLRSKQNAIIRFMAGRLSDGKRRENKRRDMYEKLGRAESFELYFAKAITISLMLGVSSLLMAVIVQEIFFVIAGVSGSMMLMWMYIRKIKEAYRKRQDELIADLPYLISSMITALEVGKPLNRIFQSVSSSSGPILSGLLKQLVANMSVLSQKDALLIFAKEVSVPIFYDFISTVNIVAEKGFHEAERDLNGIKNDLRSLNKLALKERTRGNPGKMNVYYGLVFAHVLVFFVGMVIVMFSAFNSL